MPRRSVRGKAIVWRIFGRHEFQILISKVKTMKNQHVYQQMLHTGRGRTLTALEKYQFERLSQEGYRTERDVTPCDTTQKIWITHTIHIHAKPPTTWAKTLSNSRRSQRPISVLQTRSKNHKKHLEPAKSVSQGNQVSQGNRRRKCSTADSRQVYL